PNVLCILCLDLWDFCVSSDAEKSKKDHNINRKTIKWWGHWRLKQNTRTSEITKAKPEDNGSNVTNLFPLWKPTNMDTKTTIN
ncbi:hypothetical protein VIGAN_02038400, partial [Vigna angularis var. angularis]